MLSFGFLGSCYVEFTHIRPGWKLKSDCPGGMGVSDRYRICMEYVSSMPGCWVAWRGRMKAGYRQKKGRPG